MPEAFAAALALPHLPLLLAATFAAGVVYGFAGFGAGLIFLPIATVLIDPATAIAAFALSALSSLVTLVPRAWGECDRRETVYMALAATLTLPVGIWVLRTVDPRTTQFAVSGLAALTLLVLIAGVRLSVRPGIRASVGVAGLAGVLGGATGLLGPAVILFNLAAGGGAARMRANTLVFLTLGSLLVVPQMALQGLITGHALWLGAMLLPAYAAGGLAGRALFDPRREALYRAVAYALIAVAIALGLRGAAG
ncbi:MAG: sulfite exporter TauE/SafE family protein [Pseudomonadota bacterium]